MSASSPVLRVAGFASVALVAALALSACTTPTAASDEAEPTIENAVDPVGGLFDRTWQFGSTTLDDESDYEEVAIEAPPTVRFEPDGIVRGWTGCREFTAEWVQASPDDDAYDSTGVLISNVVVDEPVCVPASSKPVAVTRFDARVLAVIDESTVISVNDYGVLSIAGAQPTLDSEPALVATFFDADDEGDAIWGSVETITSLREDLELDPDTKEHGPLVGRWTLVSGRFDEHEINPAKLLALDSQPGRRTVWTFDGTTFSTGSRCAAASGTLTGKLNRTFSAKVTQIGDCVLDRDPGTRVDYDLEADQVLAAIDALDHAEADADQLVLEGGTSDQLVFTRAG